MSAVSKTVTISPPAAAAAGCTATCTGTETTFSDGGWQRNYTATATAVGNWRFVKFTWVRTRYQNTGTPIPTDYESTSNPADSSDGLSELRVVYSSGRWAEYIISGLTAVFEYVAPPHTHLLVNSATKESPPHLVYDPTTNLLVADY